MEAAGVGRRDRKKAATRSAIAAAALRLFLERGYERVGIREVAVEADVAVTTVFAHFASKEALVFEQDAAFEARLAGAVTDRTDGEPLIAALRTAVRALLRHCSDPRVAPIWAMIDASPALREYEGAMLLRHADSLAGTLADHLGVPPEDTACRTIARFTIDAYALSRTAAEPEVVADAVFGMIEGAWTASGLDRLPTLTPKSA